MINIKLITRRDNFKFLKLAIQLEKQTKNEISFNLSIHLCLVSYKNQINKEVSGQRLWDVFVDGIPTFAFEFADCMDNMLSS